MISTYERLLKAGWVEVDGPNMPNRDHHNDGRGYVLAMHHPETGKYNARIEATNIPDICFMAVRDSLKEAVDACINSRHF